MDSPSIHTVLGPIPPESLGRTLMHEHVFCDFYRVTGDLNQLLNDRVTVLEPLQEAVSHRATSEDDVETPGEDCQHSGPAPRSP